MPQSTTFRRYFICVKFKIMKNWHTYLLVLIARFIVIGFFSFIYITPLFILFYLIIFNNLSLLYEITLKYYLISYCVGFCIVYNNTMKEDEKDDKPINKGVQLHLIIKINNASSTNIPDLNSVVTLKLKVVIEKNKIGNT